MTTLTDYILGNPSNKAQNMTLEIPAHMRESMAWAAQNLTKKYAAEAALSVKVPGTCDEAYDADISAAEIAAEKAKFADAMSVRDTLWPRFGGTQSESWVERLWIAALDVAVKNRIEDFDRGENYKVHMSAIEEMLEGYDAEAHRRALAKAIDYICSLINLRFVEETEPMFGVTDSDLKAMASGTANPSKSLLLLLKAYLRNADLYRINIPQEA